MLSKNWALQIKKERGRKWAASFLGNLVGFQRVSVKKAPDSKNVTVLESGIRTALAMQPV